MSLFQSIKAKLSPPKPSPEPPQAPAKEKVFVRNDAPLLEIITPSARDRWITSRMKDYTPERVENVFRGAMTGSLLAQWELFDLMEGTWPRLNKNLNELKDDVKTSNWDLQPWAAKGKKPTPEAQRRADIVEYCVWNMEPAADDDENDFEGMVGDGLDSWGKAISVQELLWEVRPYEGSLIIAPRASRWVHPRHYGYAQNDSRLMLNVTQSGIVLEPGEIPVEGFVPFRKNKFLISVAKQKSGHPASSSMLRLLGFIWAATNFTWEWFLNFVQIFGMPIRWANYDPNATQATRDAICDMLDNMGSAGWGAFPAGTALELKEAMKAGGDNAHRSLIDLADVICDILILGQTLTTSAGDKGSQALGTVHNKVLSGRKLAAKSHIARTLNRQFIKAICLLNFGDTRECPYFMAGVDAPEDAVALAERDKTLLDAGLPMPKAWLYERHEIPVPAAGEEVIEGRTSVGIGMPEATPGDGTPTRVNAKDAAGQLADNLLEDLSGVQARWLGGVRPYFLRLVQAAQSGTVSDADFMAAVERAHRQFPELFRNLNTEVLADRLEREMGAAAVNGAIQGFMARRAKLLPEPRPTGGAE